MKIKKGFVLRQLLGEYVVTGEGLERVNFNKIISLNATAAYLWEELKDKEFDSQAMADLLTAKYEVDPQTALSDSEKLAQSWKEAGLLED
ncbi:MAG: PqqD family protein [Bacteroidales bacterium]|nr:PqqD family protein [Bacteroidales bacterium]MBP5518902.1 PqqD family protein [Bacteroidales bacterium]